MGLSLALVVLLGGLGLSGTMALVVDSVRGALQVSPGDADRLESMKRQSAESR